MIIKGYACHWDKPNENKEIVRPESFDTTFENLKDGVKIPVNWNHDDNIVLGHVENFVVDKVGLFITVELNEEVEYVSNFILPLIKGGTLDRFSTQGWIPKNKIYKNPDGTYLAGEFNLTAVAIVTNPADRDAKFSENSLNNVHYFGFEEKSKNKILYIL